MKRRSVLSVSLFLILLNTLFSQNVLGAGYDLSVSSSLSTATINLSSQGMGDHPFPITGGSVTWGDHPYVTLEFDIQVSGNVPENPNQPEVLAKTTISISSQEGVYMDYTVDPNYVRLSFTAHVVMKIYRSSETGDNQLTISASAGGESAETIINLKLIRDKISISLTKPEENDHYQPGSIKIEGTVSPAVGGVVVNVDLYHKYPELKTQEQIQGYRSGIQLRGMTVTKSDGSFVIDESTGAFEHFPLSGITISAIKEGAWYIHFFTNGMKLYGDDLKRVDYTRPMATAFGAVKTYDSDYRGVPPLGGDVPKEHVRKFLLAKPEIGLRIEGGNPLYAEDSIGHNVFRRKTERPRFEVTLSSSAHELVSAGVAEIRINIMRPGRFNVDTKAVKDSRAQEVEYYALPILPLNFQKQSETMTVTEPEPGEEWETYESTWVATWDWKGDYGGGVTGDIEEQIPLGIYGVQAVLWDVKANKPLKVSTPKSSYVPGFDSFFVVYNFDPSDKLVTEQSYTDLVAFPVNAYADWWTKKSYVLHQYDVEIVADALKRIQSYGAWPTSAYRNLFREDITSPTTNKLDTATVITNDIISGLTRQVLRYDNKLSRGFYDTATARKEGRGICTDAAAIGMEFLRAVGVSCRYVSGRCYHVISGRTSPVGHAWLEVWDEATKKWYNFDPTNGWVGQTAIDYMAGILANPSYGQFYPADGAPLKGAGIVPLGNYEGYFVLTEDPVSKKVVNRYIEYSYVAEIENGVLDRGSGTLPEVYDPGDTVYFECDVKNPGVMDLKVGTVAANPHIRVELISEQTRFMGKGITVVRTSQTLDVRALPAITAGGSTHYTLSFKLPEGTYLSPRVRVEAYYIFNFFRGEKTYTKPAVMCSQEFAIPFEGPSTPSIVVGDETLKLRLPTRSETITGEGNFTSTEWYALEPVQLKRISLGHENATESERFVVTGITDSAEFSLNWPVEDIGESVYIPDIGLFSSDNSELNMDTSQIGIVRDGSVTVYTFSPKIRVSSLNFRDVRGERLCEVVSTWTDNVVSGEERTYIVYSETLEGTDSSEYIMDQAVFNLHERGVRLVSVEASVPVNVFSQDDAKVEITVMNESPLEQVAELYLEISQPTVYVNTTRLVLYNESVEVIRPPGSFKNLTIPLELYYTSSSLPWELVYSVEGGGDGRMPLFSEYPIGLDIEDAQLLPGVAESLDVEITNVGGYNFEEVGVAIDLHGGALALGETSTRSIGLLGPGESRLLSWSIVAEQTNYLTTSLSITAGGKPVSGAEFLLQVLGTGVVEVDDVIIEAQPAKAGEMRGLDFDIKVRNVGDYESLSSWIEVMTPEGVTDPGRLYITRLLAGEEVTVRGSIQYGLGQSFDVVLNLVDGQGVKSSATLVVEIEGSTTEFNIYDFSPVLVLLPALELVLVMNSRRRREAAPR